MSTTAKVCGNFQCFCDGSCMQKPWEWPWERNPDRPVYPFDRYPWATVTTSFGTVDNVAGYAIKINEMFFERAATLSDLIVCSSEVEDARLFDTESEAWGYLVNEVRVCLKPDDDVDVVKVVKQTFEELVVAED